MELHILDKIDGDSAELGNINFALNNHRLMQMVKLGAVTNDAQTEISF